MWGPQQGEWPNLRTQAPGSPGGVGLAPACVHPVDCDRCWRRCFARRLPRTDRHDMPGTLLLYPRRTNVLRVGEDPSPRLLLQEIPSPCLCRLMIQRNHGPICARRNASTQHRARHRQDFPAAKKCLAADGRDRVAILTRQCFLHENHFGRALCSDLSVPRLPR